MILFRPQGPKIGQEMVRDRPLRATVVECTHQRRLPGELPDEHTQSANRQSAAIEVEQVHAVETQQVSLYLIAVLVE